MRLLAADLNHRDRGIRAILLGYALSLRNCPVVQRTRNAYAGMDGPGPVCDPDGQIGENESALGMAVLAHRRLAGCTNPLGVCLMETEGVWSVKVSP